MSLKREKTTAPAVRARWGPPQYLNRPRRFACDSGRQRWSGSEPIAGSGAFGHHVSMPWSVGASAAGAYSGLDDNLLA